VRVPPRRDSPIPGPPAGGRCSRPRGRWEGARGVTTVVTGERGEGTLTRHGIEEHVSDCVIVLDQRVVDQTSERRYAAVSTDDPLARRRVLSLQDLTDRTVAVDAQTGTTTDRLCPPGAAPAAHREVAGIEEWLIVIAAGEAVGLTAEATTTQHPVAGVAYRHVRDAPPVDVHLARWADSPPAQLADLLALAREA